MNPFIFYLIYLASLLVPAVYAFALRNRVLPVHKPVLYFIWMLLIFSLTQTFTDFDSPLRVASENLQYLVEFLLVLWILRNWKIFDTAPWLLPLLIVFGLGAWTAEKILTGWNASLSWVRVGFSFVSALLAVFAISRTLVGRSGRLSRNPIFLFSLGLLLYYSLQCIYELVLFSGGIKTEAMAEPLFYFTVSVGTLFNIIYLSALICLPTRTRFSFR